MKRCESPSRFPWDPTPVCADSFVDFRSELPSIASLGKTKQSYKEALLTSAYCLCAPGNGFGVRLIDYMVSGCIPVIVNNSLWYPFEEVLPYRHFAHVFSLGEAHTVVSTLRAESESARQHRRVIMRSSYRKLLWDESHGAAYETTMRLLAQIVQQ